MICYKDMTFCIFYGNCVDGDECDRALTPEVIKKAEEWMKDPPISRWTEEPECFIRKGEK